MSEIQRLPLVVNPNPVHPNAKSTTQINNGTTTTKSNISTPVCRNCKTQTTPLWRRDETGQVLCNACGLFLKLHGRPRPISLKTDTIKLRNRIKQPNFSKSLGSNTPELKLKDHKISEATPGKKSPKLMKRRLPPDSEIMAGSGYTTFGATGVHSPLQHATRPGFASGAFLQSNGFSNLPTQVQLLHYPLSTPTQFAPGLQRITSPLMLSTTPSMLNARLNGLLAGQTSPKGPLTAVQAAGALENMLNELGPLATFKGQNALLNNVSLMGSSLSTPLSALKTSPRPPTLPTLDKEKNVIASPSFGPQFHLSDASTTPELKEVTKTALPPLQHLSNRLNQGPLPHMSAVAEPGQLGSFKPASLSSSGAKNEPSSERAQDPNRSDDSDGLGNNNNNNNSNNGGPGSTYEVSALKTRISELELVNDLYRTRIMELEAMEQAARLRENSMRRRLDDLLQSHGQPDSQAMLSSIKLKREPDQAESDAKRPKFT